MKFSGLCFAKKVLPLAGLFPGLILASEWNYTGPHAPEHWGELDSEYRICQQGKNQSPVDINHSLTANISPLSLNYSHAPSNLQHNGHTIQASFEPNTINTFSLDGVTWNLKQFHFHTPSENTFHGRHYAMEMHLVHQSPQGEIAVIAVMFEPGTANPELAKLWQALPAATGDSTTVDRSLNLNTLLPADKSYWRFSGSLTTPPCSEGVIWLVMKYPLTLSAAQLAQFKSVMHHDNNRPVQPLHGRVIVE